MVPSTKNPAAPGTLSAEFTRVLAAEADALSRASKRFAAGTPEESSVLRALELMIRTLEQGGKIVVSGLGKSGKVAQKISATLASTGSPSVHLHPTEALHGDLGLIGPADLLLALSHTGNTDEIVRLAVAVRSLRIPVVGIGGNPTSQLAGLCDAWLDGSVETEACPHNLAPTTSTTLAMALGDALAVALMKHRGFDASSFARNHPGGSLGRRLHLKVRDVMQPAEKTPILPATASMQQVVEASSRQNLGAVLIAGPDLRLQGIITDGDLRRALARREKFFDLEAREVMTAQPVTIGPDALAHDALEKMENRPSQIKELPVVDANFRIEGLVRIHDLLKFF
jgi:arabinose-5-phosphate isomerase